MASCDGQESPGTARSEPGKTLVKKCPSLLRGRVVGAGRADTETPSCTVSFGPPALDTPSPALSGLGRPDKIPKAPSARASTTTARQRRVESPRIASFDHFTVRFTSAAARTEPTQGQGLHPPASLGRAMPTPNWRAGQRSHINIMLTIFCNSTAANDLRI